jgi:hypothetical protein
MHGISSDGLFARETRAVREDGQCVASNSAALGEEKLAAPHIETGSPSQHHKNSLTRFASGSRHAFVGHSYDRARDRVYRSLLLLGPHSGHWRRRLDRFLPRSCSRRGGSRRISPSCRTYCARLDTDTVQLLDDLLAVRRDELCAQPSLVFSFCWHNPFNLRPLKPRPLNL